MEAKPGLCRTSICRDCRYSVTLKVISRLFWSNNIKCIDLWNTSNKEPIIIQIKLGKWKWINQTIRKLCDGITMVDLNRILEVELTVADQVSPKDLGRCSPISRKIRKQQLRTIWDWATLWKPYATVGFHLLRIMLSAYPTGHFCGLQCHCNEHIYVKYCPRRSLTGCMIWVSLAATVHSMKWYEKGVSQLFRAARVVQRSSATSYSLARISSLRPLICFHNRFNC